MHTVSPNRYSYSQSNSFCAVAVNGLMPQIITIIWADKMVRMGRSTTDDPVMSPGYEKAPAPKGPFSMFALTMTERSIRAGRKFELRLVVLTSDHVAGALTASVFGVLALEAGNRMSWSMRASLDISDGHQPQACRPY